MPLKTTTGPKMVRHASRQEIELMAEGLRLAAAGAGVLRTAARFGRSGTRNRPAGHPARRRGGHPHRAEGQGPPARRGRLRGRPGSVAPRQPSPHRGAGDQGSIRSSRGGTVNPRRGGTGPVGPSPVESRSHLRWPQDPRGQVVVVEGTLDAMGIAAIQLARVIEMHPGTPASALMATPRVGTRSPLPAKDGRRGDRPPG